MGVDDEPPGWTRETPAPGLVCWQPRRGYRYGVEAYALASFALDGLGRPAVPPPGAGEGPASVLDLGAGSGIVSLLLASRGLKVIAVERDERWRPGIERSIPGSGLDVVVLWGDARMLVLPPVDMVVSNPPWFDLGSGPISPDDHKAHARTALHGGPCEFVLAGLRAAPRVCIVVPATTGLPAVPGASLTRSASVGGLLLGEFSTGPGRATECVRVDPYAPFRAVSER